jgi:hypothetical protein
MSIGIALDATNTHADASVIQGIRYQGAGDPIPLHAIYCDFPGVGYHYLQVTEFTAGGTATFYGDAGKGVFMWSGAVGYIFA